jgi:exopolyphosphatase/guanosine-5'-triphosphate,3'-diphosphate pyrophosphatase
MLTERVAIIDLGSNSARLIVMHIYHNGAYNLVYHQKEAVRLSEGMTETLELQPEAIKRALQALKIFAHMCQICKVDKIIGVATAAVRNAHNGKKFLQMVTEATGIVLTIASGETEAKLGFLGVINTIDVSDAVLFDLGGGSTELTLIKNRKNIKSVSLPFGAVTLTEKFGLRNKITDSQVNDLHNFIASQLKKLSWLADLHVPLIGVGGTARNIAKMDQRRKNYPVPKVHNYRLGVISFEDLWKGLLKTSLAQRRKYPGLSTERADIILAGINIVKCLFDFTKSSQLIISGCGVREGLFFQHYYHGMNQPDVASDILMNSATNMLVYSAGDIAHSQHVRKLAESLFDGWQTAFELDNRDKTLLSVVALLHDIGITINYYDHPRHSAYLVENARLFGLTHREQMLAAVVVGWHHNPAVKYFRSRNYTEFLDEHDWQTARKLALMLALAESLDTTQMGLIEELQAYCTDTQACIKLILKEPADIEIQAALRHSRWMKKDMNYELVIK